MYVLTLFITSWLTKSSMSTEHALATAETATGEVVKVDIALDNTTMLTYPGKPDPPQACFEESINFHDFEKQLLALKIVDKAQCLIKSSTETYEQVKEIVDSIHQGNTKPIKQVTEEWGVSKDPLPSEKVESTVGKKIAKFCTGYKVYMLDESKDIISVRGLPRISRAELRLRMRGARGCWICAICSGFGR